MVFPDKYKALKIKSLSELEYSIVPIRYKDRFKIMQWRNEQLFHLRQVKPLTEKDQENYFRNVVAKLFEQEKPNQLLFSYLKNNECIGYGGLVHINWFDKNAEISFIISDPAITASFTVFAQKVSTEMIISGKLFFNNFMIGRSFCNS